MKRQVLFVVLLAALLLSGCIQPMQAEQPGFNDQLAAINGNAAEFGANVEQKALATEQKIADGWHWFTGTVEDYRYTSSDWWLRRRGIDPVALR